MSRLNEFEWINKYLAPLSGEGAFGLTDDAAILKAPAGDEIVITQDAIVSGIHFFPDDPADCVARKALRVNISDLIAKGATPFAYSLALGVPTGWTEADFASFADGLGADQEKYDLILTGGDTCSSPERLTASVTMIGAVTPGHYVKRCGARAGDALFVTGTIGDAAIGLQLRNGALQGDKPSADYVRRCYLLPEPPFGFQRLVREFATASMDISDGLAGDCAKLCLASKVGATIERNAIPLSNAVRGFIAGHEKLWNSVLGGGDDYQVLFTASKDREDDLIAAACDIGISVCRIGQIHAGETGNIRMTVDGNPVEFEAKSYSHF